MKIKKTAKKQKIKWLPKPEDHNYPAAKSYLSLIFNETDANRMSKSLKNVPIIEFKAKDIFRASKLSLLGISNLHVNKNIKKIKAGNKISPILLVRDSKSGNVVIADGYHRMCAVYHFNEDALIPCQII